MDTLHDTLGSEEFDIETFPKDRHVAFFMQVGMMETHDDQSTPTGVVVIDRGEMTVTTAAYKIIGTGFGKRRPVVTHIWQRQRGVDILPRFSQWCDPDTAAAIGRFLDAHGLPAPTNWVTYCREANFGPNYLTRFKSMDA